MGSWLQDGENSSPASELTQPWNLIEFITKTYSSIPTLVFPKLSEFVVSVYSWAKEENSRKLVTSFFQNFWKSEMWKPIATNFLWSVKDWLEILFNVDLLGKTVKSLNNAWQLTEKYKSAITSNQKLQEMISWIWSGPFINLKEMINLLDVMTNLEDDVVEEGQEEDTSSSCGSSTFNWIDDFKKFLKNSKDKKDGKCLMEVFSVILSPELSSLGR